MASFLSPRRKDRQEKLNSILFLKILLTLSSLASFAALRERFLSFFPAWPSLRVTRSPPLPQTGGGPAVGDGGPGEGGGREEEEGYGLLNSMRSIRTI